MFHSGFSSVLRQLIGAILTAAALLLAMPPAHAMEKATVQLKWLHHFQFAGYYAALEKGYYHEAGLDVTILEGGPAAEVEKDVASGRADFGVGTSALLLNLAQGQDFVVLGQVFQHSPAVFLTPRKTGIHSVGDMAGRRFMYSNQHGDMLALLKKTGITEDRIVKVPHQGNPLDLIEGKADVMIAYSFNEPYIMEQAGEPYLTFSPLSLGIDFYGDNFFTTRSLVNDRPGFVQAFRAATLRGWSYALNNKNEIADLILAKYSKSKSREWLLFEANQVETLIQPNLVELGYQSPARWQRISETFSGLGMLPEGFDPSPIIYAPKPSSDDRPLIAALLIFTATISALTWLVFTFRNLNSKLKEQIDERKKIEDALRNSELRLRNLFETMQEGFALHEIICDDVGKPVDYRFLDLNPAFELLTGLSRSAIINRTVLEVMPQTEPHWIEAYGRVALTGQSLELENHARELDRYYRVKAYSPAQGQFAVLFADITAQKKALLEAELRQEQLRVLFESSQAGILMVGPDGRIQVVNQRACEMFACDQEALLDNWYPNLVHPEQRGSGTDSMKMILAGEIDHVSTERHYVRNDGSDFWGYISVRRHKDAEGNLVSLVCHVSDITELKRAEEGHRQMEKQLLHTQKLESLGVLAGGIAHDFNNILMAIIGNADLALMRINKESPAVDNLHRIEQAAARAADLAKQMLAYSGKGRFVVENMNLNLLLEEMLHMLQVSISKKAVLRFNLHKHLPPVEADATQMRQIVMNLVINASEAIEDKSGVIAITTGCMDCDRNYLKDVWLDENLTDGLYVYLEIADSGCGMDKETMAKLFDPFFTTKFAGRGLGMAAVLGIVRGHKGAIKVYSEPGKGTSFKILLPASGKPVELFNHDSRQDDWQGSGTVLLVDDEETVRGIGTEMLKVLGFTTITANDGREALEIFKATPDIAFVILDLTMPHIDGEQCFRELRQLNPDVKVIMSSGYNEQEVTQRFVGKGLAGFVQKPYKLSVLKDAISGLARQTE